MQIYDLEAYLLCPIIWAYGGSRVDLAVEGAPAA
jgi:hypothetical protein